jgi:hypothetical protein
LPIHDACVLKQSNCRQPRTEGTSAGLEQLLWLCLTEALLGPDRRGLSEIILEAGEFGHPRFVASFNINSARIRELAARGDIGALIGGASRAVARISLSVGLRRDLTLPHIAPAARCPFSLRVASADDLSKVLSLSQPGLSLADQQAISVRMTQAEQCLGRAFVAIQADGHPCFVQWVLSEADNSCIATFFGGRFPPLKGGEALLENAFTPPAFRGLGIMPAAMSEIAESLGRDGFRTGLTFVASDNTPSLHGCRRAGFHPYLLRRDISLLLGLFRRRRFLAADPTNSREGALWSQ